MWVEKISWPLSLCVRTSKLLSHLQDEHKLQRKHNHKDVPTCDKHKYNVRNADEHCMIGVTSTTKSSALFHAGCHMYNTQNTSERSISASTRKRDLCSSFLCLCLFFFCTSTHTSVFVCLCLSQKCKPCTREVHSLQQCNEIRFAIQFSQIRWHHKRRRLTRVLKLKLVLQRDLSSFISGGSARKGNLCQAGGRDFTN